MFKWTRRILLVTVLGLVAALVAGDLLAKHFAEQRIAAAIHDRTHGVADVKATVHSFPFVGRLLVQGRVSELDIALVDVAGHGIDVSRLDAKATDITLDKGALFSKQNVHIKGVGTVTITATITEQALRSLVHVDVPMPEGATFTVTNGRLRLPTGLSVPVPDAQLLPCTATASVEHGVLVLRCTSHSLPQVVVDAVGAASLRG
ncbi:MAG TPA: DUF2993 domain-containing protein [Mycobacteriales bacterium]|nr:DUF2993 domain-containing protein [Mycobacteriales bacterium]